jgi:hypothetical protein
VENRQQEFLCRAESAKIIYMKKSLKCLSLILLCAICVCAQQPNSSANPCENAEMKAFDFQIGIWQSKDGNEVHEIKKILNGCGVWEIWTRNGSEQAVALKSFDSGRHTATGEQKWFYSWAASGFHQLWEGRKENGQWRFYRQWVLEGQPILSRTYWNPLADGSIDRIVEQSRDGGKTWKPHVKVNFVRKKN